MPVGFITELHISGYIKFGLDSPAKLCSQVSFRVQYPNDYQDLSYEDLKEFKQTRYGSDVLSLLNMINQILLVAL